MKYINIAPAANKTSYSPLSFPVLPRQTAVIHPDIHSGKYPDSYSADQSDNYPDSYPDNQSDNYPTAILITSLMVFVRYRQAAESLP